MSTAWDEAERYDGAFQGIWQNQNQDTWDFDALDAVGQDWGAWNNSPNDDFWNDNFTPAFPEPYASSSTLDGHSSPHTSHALRDSHQSRRESRSRQRARTPDLRLSPIPSLNNRSAYTSQSQTQSTNATTGQSRSSAADDFASPSHGFNGEVFDLDNPDTPSSFDGIDIDDILNTDEESDMPPSTRRRQRDQSNTVDLTAESSPTRSSPPLRSRQLKRRADQSNSQPRAKRSRRSSNANTNSNAPPSPEIEQLDLTNEAPSAEEELRQTQQEAAIKAQQADNNNNNGPIKLGQRQCIICMEKYTDATITHCGHVYCHECLTQALIAGEKNSDKATGNCPVCRKPVSRKRDRHMIVVNFMKRNAFREGKGRRDGLSAFAFG